MKPLSPKEKAFGAEVRAGLSRWTTAEKETLRLIRQHLKEYRAEILSSFPTGTEWQQHHLAQVDEALREATQTVNRKLRNTWANTSSKAVAEALHSANSPLNALGLNASTIHSQVPLQELALLNDYVPSLIVDVSAEVQKRVQTRRYEQ